MTEAGSIAGEQKIGTAEGAFARRGGPYTFAKLMLLFFLPLVVIGACVEVVLWRTGETWPMERVIAAQEEEGEALFMRGILDQGFYRYKALNVAERKPRILALGSSRVMEFRKEMFGERAEEFYNAGGMIQNLADLNSFIVKRNYTPEIILLGLDVWWFSGAQLWPEGWSKGAEYDAAEDWQAHWRAVRRFKSSKTYKPAFRAWPVENEHIGVEARTKGAGFRRDGSMRYGFATPLTEEEWKFVDRENPPITERIRSGSSPLIPNRGVDREQVRMLREILALLKGRNVVVLGYLPPFGEEAARLMETHPGQAKLWKEAQETIPRVFEEYGQPFIDASTTGRIGLDDRYLIDGLHAAETFQVHLLLRFLEVPGVREKLPGLEKRLRNVVAAQKTNPWYPDYAPVARE